MSWSLLICRWIFGFPVVVVVLGAVVTVGKFGNESAAAARSAKNLSNSDDVKDSWSPVCSLAVCECKPNDNQWLARFFWD